MNRTERALLRAMYKNEMVAVSYKNADGHEFDCWIGIREIVPENRLLRVEVLYPNKPGEFQPGQLFYYSLDRILSARNLEGVHYDTPPELRKQLDDPNSDIYNLFSGREQETIFDYYLRCFELERDPIVSKYMKAPGMDAESFENGRVHLNANQFEKIVACFTKKKEQNNLGLNALSLEKTSMKPSAKLLAYYKLQFNPVERTLSLASDLIFTKNSEGYYVVEEYLEKKDAALLSHPENNLDQIADCLRHSQNKRVAGSVVQIPWVLDIPRDYFNKLPEEYSCMASAAADGTAAYPLRAFLGDCRPEEENASSYKLMLTDKNNNADQLESIHFALTQPLSFVQGPPGTGKTKTIEKAILSAMANGQTVLFASANNKPLNDVCKDLKTITFQGYSVPLPVLRLGNASVMEQTLNTIREAYHLTEQFNVDEADLLAELDKSPVNADAFKRLIAAYSKKTSLLEGKYAIVAKLKEGNLPEAKRKILEEQLSDLEHYLERANGLDKEVEHSLQFDLGDVSRYLYCYSLRALMRLQNNEDLRAIVSLPDKEKQLSVWNSYLSKSENIGRLLEAYPIVVCTNMSAYRIGQAEPHFDVTVLDEASQCSPATALLSVARGRRLCLTGDPKQLNPVVTLKDSYAVDLQNRLRVKNEYDYCGQSIYDVYCAVDPLSPNAFLRKHYRCAPEIIEFNNKKYYDGRLEICTSPRGESALQFVNIEHAKSREKNVSFLEKERVLAYVEAHPEESIGIITPFSNQEVLFQEGLKKKQYKNVQYGTIHKFQGAEKDTVILSLAITDNTKIETYRWLAQNEDLLNVATSRAKKKLVVFASDKNVERLHEQMNGAQDNLYELIQYVKSKGTAIDDISPCGGKTLTTFLERRFRDALNLALQNLAVEEEYSIKDGISLIDISYDEDNKSDLLWTGRVDFGLYDKFDAPVAVFELDGEEHETVERRREDDREKQNILDAAGVKLFRFRNEQAGDYSLIKKTLAELLR